MSFPDDTLLPEDRCEICGAELGDEIVIQEFADGSLARLCSECATGAVLDTAETPFVFPEPPEDDWLAEEDETSPGEGPGEVAAMASPATPAEPLGEESSVPVRPTPGTLAFPSDAAPVSPEVPVDPLDKTRELLTPVADLLTLQKEMQAALQRLAASLEVFASDVIAEKLERASTLEDRIESLERELEATRAKLRQTEALLAAATGAGFARESEAELPSRTEAELPSQPEAVPEFVMPPRATPAPVNAGSAGPISAPLAATEDTEELPAADSSLVAPVEPAEVETADAGEPAPAGTTGEIAVGLATPVTPLVPPPGVAQSRPAFEYHAFDLAEVQLAQRYYNESPFTQRIRDVRRSLGRPKANLTKLPGALPRALLTVAWDIIWYQYLIDLRRDVPSAERVVLHREGFDLDELASIFKEKNCLIDDEGRLDASELEVKLLSDPTVLLTEMTPEEERALEDATEEIWDQRTAPEFKWDD